MLYALIMRLWKTGVFTSFNCMDKNATKNKNKLKQKYDWILEIELDEKYSKFHLYYLQNPNNEDSKKLEANLQFSESHN